MREDSRPLGSVTRLRVAAYLEDGDVVKTDRLSVRTDSVPPTGRSLGLTREGAPPLESSDASFLGKVGTGCCRWETWSSVRVHVPPLSDRSPGPYLMSSDAPSNP